MDESWRLLSLSCAMFVGSFVAGSVPLAVSFSERSLRIVSLIGAGLLVGTALAVIIPEGVHTLYDQHEQMFVHEAHSHHLHTREGSSLIPSTIVDGITATKEMHKHSHEHSGQSLELHTLIGVSLCLGFVFMLIVDQISGGHPHGSSDSENKRASNRSLTATIGLVIHSAADGIALGAAARSSRTDIEMIVFFAIMLHKAPAAFGLTTFLLHDSYERNRIRRHLLAFSLAAPFGAILTFYGLSQGSKEVLSSVNGTGIAMLFSAGTFLYVATVHILPDMSHFIARPSLEEGSSNSNEHSHDRYTRCDLCSLIGGILAPLLFASLHQH